MSNKAPRVKMLKPAVKELQTTRIKTISASSWRAGKTTAERGYTYAWQQARERFLRAHPLCCYCERQGRWIPASVVDHIKPHQGDDRLFWDEANWQPLCKPCHDTVKAKEERGQR
jgi:5-methylcytosine-specific restriction protein A